MILDFVSPAGEGLVCIEDGWNEKIQQAVQFIGNTSQWIYL
jgi:hypothetical protein